VISWSRKAWDVIEDAPTERLGGILLFARSPAHGFCPDDCHSISRLPPPAGLQYNRVMQIVPTPNPTLDAYYAALSNYAALGVTHEQGIRSAFRTVLETFANACLDRCHCFG
jgi:hypothetical protein